MIMRDRSIRVVLLLMVAWVLPCNLAVTGQDASVVTVSTFWSHTGVRPGGRIALAVVVEIRDPYHINANTAKPPFIPTQVEIISAEFDLRNSTPLYPQPHEIDFGIGEAREKNSVFSTRAVIFIPMAVNESADRREVPIKLKVSYQACDARQCLLPTSMEQEVNLQIVPQSAEVKPLHEELFQAMKDRQDRVTVSFF